MTMTQESSRHSTGPIASPSREWDPTAESTSAVAMTAGHTSLEPTSKWWTSALTSEEGDSTTGAVIFEGQ